MKVRASYTGADQLRLSGCGLLNEDSVLHLGTWRENQNLTGKHLQTIFNRLQSTSLSLFFGKMDDREEIKKV